MLKKYSFLFLFLLLFWIPISIFALGYKFNFFLLYANYYLLFLAIYLIFRKYFAFIFFFHALICVLYLPVGLTLGTLNIGMMNSILRTNIKEIFEFISQFPIKYLIYSLLFFIFSIFLSYFCWKTKNLIHLKFNKILSYSVYISVLIFAGKVFIEPLLFDFKLEFYLMKNNPYSKFYRIIVEKYDEIKILRQSLNYNDNFEIIETKPKYKNYFLVIGESMRNDYTSLYSYPIDTTPFLRKVKGRVYDGFVVPSANTPTSLTRILFWNKFGGSFKDYYTATYQEFKIFDNIINLAKKSKYKIFWISNHGQNGDIDVATTTIAKICDEYFFTIKGTWVFNLGKRDIFDRNLLPILKEKITNNKSNNNINLYVLHIIGSHEPYCNRLGKEEKLSYKTPNEKFSCYLHSLTKTDKFLEDLDKLLKEELKEDYSVLYFSDHGVSHLDNTHYLRHSPNYQQNYESPLVIFSGDDTQQQRIKVKKSGYNFIFAFAEWLGIREKNLEAENYTFFNNEDDKNIKVYNWDKDVDFDSLPRDIRFIDSVEKLEP